MADVSVRFQVAGDSEIVLNLATGQAVRLVEAIMRKVSEAMSAQAAQASQNGLSPGMPMQMPAWPDMSGGPSTGGGPQHRMPG
ncbi:hypothetical protein [Pseudofrankia inefficax]|jgi:hypothetical protein|uniref:Uncharacterized protein n=1 Tax=Pseudofrankia inefficax (strain DSM 45817 / CECT 9037 / DDB 130130 / EuI1c) TaxID=298654 RepID=E3IZA9_PSEI1|nr:hypothetical protein [Pseudofrankia inefficax]ADP81536.1 hypothetical protein FraEuI1c_3527 [Pseudofrankia inefficax]